MLVSTDKMSRAKTDNYPMRKLITRPKYDVVETDCLLQNQDIGVFSDTYWYFQAGIQL